LGEVKFCLDLKIRIGALDIINERGALLADPGLAVVTGDVVPMDPIAVEIVQQGEAVLGRTVLLLLPVVWLWLSQSVNKYN
jgi:hypothetical protein